jgi:VIT1/CCC1 family predicted Fe2+/Mn2+ transporter
MKMTRECTGKELSDFVSMQQSEAEGIIIYSKLARISPDTANAKILSLLSREESRHYSVLKKYTKRDVKAAFWPVFKSVFFARVLGLTFSLKLMEKGENRASAKYMLYKKRFPDVAAIAGDEDAHEDKLIAMLQEEKLSYMGSVVLGLNDALVELTGALVGFTFALSNSRLIALIGLITGISAALSMAASEYLSTKAEGGANSAIKASVYTGIAYIITVALLIAPYLLLSNSYLSLGIMFFLALSIIALFNYYYSVVKDESFTARFTEMAVLSGAVSLVSFLIGFVLKRYTGLDL